MSDTETGPNAFASVRMLNQRIWDADPERAERAALDSLSTGGFSDDCIARQVGGYEGQIFAIRRGWVERRIHTYTSFDGSERSFPSGWIITDAGRKAMRESGREVPTFLPALDSWHGSKSAYCAYETCGKDGPMLRIMKDAIGAHGSLCMHPLLSVSDAKALRDYLSDWIVRSEGEK